MKKQAKAEKALRSDNGERRSGLERRKFSYTLYIPERRNGQDRRDCNDCCIPPSKNTDQP
jgi:hypothetical protein